MANRTVKDANSIHGTNPQYLVEKIIRTRIYESKYWKEECFGLTGKYLFSMLLAFQPEIYSNLLSVDLNKSRKLVKFA